MDKDRVDSIMQGHMVDDVSEMGFTAGLIREVVERRLRELGKLGSEGKKLENILSM